MSEVNLSSSVGFSNSSLSNQCSTVAVFTEPTSRSQKRVRKVLEEDDYIEKIDKIIERDFFPDVAKLKAQLAYQEASERGDLVEMARLREQWTQSRPETVRSSVLDTPVILSRTDEESKLNHSEGDKEPAVPDATLDKFLVKYTSEDNASFQEILDETKAREMVKYPWLFLNEEKANQEVNEAKSLPSIETQAIEDKRPAGLLTWHFKNKNTVMYYPEGTELTRKEREDLGKNSKTVVHENTRFSKTALNKVVKATATEALAFRSNFTEGRIGVDGHPVTADGPQINGYSMVSMTPTPLPSNIDSTPFMTWGEIEGTPCRLDANDVPIEVAPVGTPYFRIPETSKRDALAQSLTDKLSSKNREKKKKALDHATRSLKSPLVGGTPNDRLSEMSPAAQRLATAKLGFSGSSDKALRASYSPAINVTPSPRRAHSRATPSPALFPSGASKPCNTASSSTDNLLKKSKRSKASDFF